MGTTISRLAAWLGLFGRGATWAAFLPYAALLVASNYALNAIIARPELFPPTRAGLFFLGINLLQYLLWTFIALFLARRLGGDPPRTAWGWWVLLVIVYLLLRQYLPAIIIAPVLLFMDWTGSVSPISSALGLVVSFILFPIVLRLAAAAHSGNDLRLRAIWAYLMREGSPLYLLFIVVDVATFLLDLGVNRVVGSGTLDLLGLQAFNALRGIALILFYVMAYREIRATQPPPDRAFA